jgi:hypothetical protein
MHTRQNTPNTSTGLRPGWLLRVLLILVFVAQLFMVTQHHHALDKAQDGCVACDLAVQFAGSAPAADAAVLALVLVCFLVLRSARYHFIVSLRRHLLPCSQAPPACS